MKLRRKLLTITEAASIIGVHPETLRRWDRAGSLKAIRIGTKGTRRYRREDIDKVIKKK